jgi:hypothetical protein
MLALVFILPSGADRIVVLEEDFQTEDGWEEDPQGVYTILPDGWTWVVLDEAVLPTPAFIIEIIDGGTGMSSVQYGRDMPVVPDIFEDASAMSGLAWLVDLTVWASKAPYTARVIVCNNENPWNGTSETVIVPTGHQEKAIAYRVLLPPTDVLYTDTVLLILHLGGQGEVVLGFDDIVVTVLDAFVLFTMEQGTPRQSIQTATGNITFTEGVAHRGIAAAQHAITEGGSSLAGCEVTMRCRPLTTPGKNFRISLAASADRAPYSFQVGIRDRTTGDTRMAGDVGTIPAANQWQEFSWVVANVAGRNLEVVIRDGGQGAANILFDDVLVEWTTEEAPTPVDDWAIH